ncbi:MAG: hypothetical protein LJE83_08925 [Gammaproteobacteria bacterium]|nr:hypothetical protein [Gammaproteobacteria bacterium]
MPTPNMFICFLALDFVDINTILMVKYWVLSDINFSVFQAHQVVASKIDLG